MLAWKIVACMHRTMLWLGELVCIRTVENDDWMDFFYVVLSRQWGFFFLLQKVHNGMLSANRFQDEG